MSPNVYEMVLELKRTNIDVLNREGDIIASLKPINGNSLGEIDVLADKMTIWRNQAMPFFKTGFHATDKRTKNWLMNSVIPDKKKILYLIYVENKPIGHFGLCNINEESAELDNAIRGERGGQPDLFTYVENAILITAFDKLKVKTIYGKLFSNNFMAMTLHKRFGFVENRRSPLKLVKREDEWEYIECSQEEAETKFQYVELMLPNNRFKSFPSGERNFDK